MSLSISITKRYANLGGNDFCLDINLEAPPGITIIFGASGSGKTTLLKAIAGILRPDRGRIAADGGLFFDSETGTDCPMRDRKVGYVSQHLALFPHRTVFENVSYGLHQIPRHQRRSLVIGMLDSLGISHLSERRPAQISGGEQQRVALARALVTHPRVLLLDEPMSALDAAVKRALISDLKSLIRKMQIPALYVTHSREEAMALGERVFVVESGRLIASGQPLDVLGAPRSAVLAQLLGVENVFEATIVAEDARQGTARCEIGGCSLEIPYDGRPMGDRVRVAIRARDILIATHEPHHLSARNRLVGTITHQETAGHEAHLMVDVGVPFQIILTPESCEELNLGVGQKIWLVIKTHSCHLLD